MSELHQDHIHLLRLLNILNRHVKDLLNDGDPDLLLMIDIVDYIRGYSDFFHHPIEDRVYNKFKECTKEGSFIVNGLLNEHQQIPKVTVAFQQLLEGALGGAIIINRKDLSERITNFIDIQKNHLDMEEEKLFPLINKILKESDWEELETQIKERDDPLFGAKVEARYDALYKKIDA